MSRTWGSRPPVFDARQLPFQRIHDAPGQYRFSIRLHKLIQSLCSCARHFCPRAFARPVASAKMSFNKIMQTCRRRGRNCNLRAIGCCRVGPEGGRGAAPEHALAAPD
eukprot:394706-Pleurochrysis_carterae.AAC.2